jgi:hypothetical protein
MKPAHMKRMLLIPDVDTGLLCFLILHPVDLAVPGPSSERLSLVVEQNAEQTPKQDKRGVGHDGWNVPVGDDPGGDELAEAVAPHVLVDGDGDEQAAGDGLVRVDGVGADHAGQGGDLDAGARVANEDDCFPGPVMLVSDRDNDIAEEHDYDIGNHGWEPHLRFTHAAVPLRCAGGHPVAEWACSCKANKSAKQDGKVGET